MMGMLALRTVAAGARRSFSTVPKPIALIVQVEIQKERTAAFLEAMSIDVKGSRTEEGCHTFDLLQDQSDPQKFIFYEVYKDADAIAVHKETPHCKYRAAALPKLPHSWVVVVVYFHETCPQHYTLARAISVPDCTPSQARLQSSMSFLF